uniref:LINE-1 type transposase domain-containing 1 n=2 Tax=Knipowitschia caucasica TaxID=637954 RepID=A0AAV2K9Q4_KNICA
MASHDKKFDTVFNKMETIQANQRKNETETARCLKELAKLREDLVGQEDRSRRNNIRLGNLPPGVEGDDPLGYIQKMLPKWIPALSGRSPIEIDRAHRIYSTRSSKAPRVMIFRLLRYTDRQAILDGARKSRPTLQDGTPLWFSPDYSITTSQRRQAYNEVRAKLRKKGINTFLIYPAILKVNHNGQRWSFNTPDEAKETLTTLLEETSEDPVTADSQ